MEKISLNSSVRTNIFNYLSNYIIICTVYYSFDQHIAYDSMESACCIGDIFQRTQPSLVLTGKHLFRIL